MNLFVIFLKMLCSYTIATIIMVSMKLALVIFDFLVRSEHMDRNHFLQEQLLLSLSLETDTKNFPSHPLSLLVMFAFFRAVAGGLCIKVFIVHRSPQNSIGITHVILEHTLLFLRARWASGETRFSQTQSQGCCGAEAIAYQIRFTLFFVSSENMDAASFFRL